MNAYAKRLIKCGYSEEKAFKICRDFVKNLGIVDLECFVYAMERKYVD